VAGDPGGGGAATMGGLTHSGRISGASNLIRDPSSKILEFFCGC
jgi:hypothetical protein